MKRIIVLPLILFAFYLHGQNNSYNKQTTMASLKPLSEYTQNWISKNWNNLSNTQVAHFMGQAKIEDVMLKYKQPYQKLKGVATSKEIEDLYKSFTEQNLKTLLDKYKISY